VYLCVCRVFVCGVCVSCVCVWCGVVWCLCVCVCVCVKYSWFINNYILNTMQNSEGMSYELKEKEYIFKHQNKTLR